MRITHRTLCHEILPWLSDWLRASRPGWRVDVLDSSGKMLSGLIREERLQPFFPLYDLWDSRVPLIALFRRGKAAELGLVHCQVAPITIRDLGPFLITSRLVSPLLALALSPAGVSPGLRALLRAGTRPELLDYGRGRKMRIGTWNAERRTVNHGVLFPRTL